MGSNEVPISQDSWESILKKLDLPLSYTFDLANRKHIPTRIVLGNTKSNHKISELFSRSSRRRLLTRTLGMVCQSPSLEFFMTLALTFDPVTRGTRGFYGFQMNRNRPTPGMELLDMIQHDSNQIEDPMLMPALFYCIWINNIQHQHNSIGREMRKVQKQTGLMSDYLRQQKLVENTINFDSVHRKLVSQHAYLTNGLSDFVLR